MHKLNILMKNCLYKIIPQKIGDKMEKETEVPTALFKYKTLNEYTYDLIKTDLIFLPTYNLLNDAFEGHITYNETILLDFIFDKILKDPLIKKNMIPSEYEKIINSKNPKEELKKWVYSEKDTINPELEFDEFSLKFIESLKETINFFLSKEIDQMKNKTFVLSFSEENNLNTLWSHYSDSNKGICIEYGFYDYNFINKIKFCHKTKYLDKNDYRYHTKDLKNIPETDSYNFFVEPFLRKTFDWKYEKEWRIILPTFSYLINLSKKIGEKQFLKLPKPKAIYLGIFTEEKDKEIIKDICKKRKIELYQMKKSNREPMLISEPIIEFPRSMHGTEFLENDMKTKNVESIIYNYFNKLQDEEHTFQFLTEALSKLPENDKVYFLDKILFKKEAMPVLLNYYPNVLIFLNILNKSRYFNELKTSDGLTIKENINQWIYKCLTNWEDNKIVRYSIIFENLFKQYHSRYFLLKEDNDEFNYQNDLKNITLISDYSSNKENLIHPFSDPDFDDLININIITNLKELFKKIYIPPCFNEEECYKEYLNLKNIVENINDKTQEEYEKINRNLLWDRLIILNNNFNWTISGICNVLINNKELLDLLDEPNKKMIKKLSEIKFETRTKKDPNKIANYLEDCCKYLNIEYTPKTYAKSLIKQYYDPKNYNLDLFN